MSCTSKENLKPVYYNIGGDIVTVCLLVNCKGKVVARGLTIKSPHPQIGEELDPPRQIAKHRALRALKGRRVDPVRRIDVIKHLMAVNCPFLEKASAHPKPTQVEKELLTNKGKKKETAKLVVLG